MGTSADNFTVIKPPAISSFTPASGPVGMKVPGADTQEKGTPADEQGAGKRGVEGADTPGITLGDMTEDAHTV